MAASCIAWLGRHFVSSCRISSTKSRKRIKNNSNVAMSALAACTCVVVIIIVGSGQCGSAWGRGQAVAAAVANANGQWTCRKSIRNFSSHTVQLAQYLVFQRGGNASPCATLSVNGNLNSSSRAMTSWVFFRVWSSFVLLISQPGRLYRVFTV